jgi:LysM repeat protein
MHGKLLRRLFLGGCLLVTVLAAGCFQAAGDTLQSTSVAQGIATFTQSPTQQPPPSETPSPEPETTEDPFATATPESSGSVLAQPTEEEQVDFALQLESGDMTATALIERATLQAATMTALANPTEVIVTLPPVATETPDFSQPVPTQPIISGADCIHVVRASDRNLWRISLLYGVTVHQIAASTGIANIQLIHIGDQLIIPGCGTSGSSQSPPGGDQGGGSPGGGSGGGVIHTVRQNETLFQISLQYGVTVSAIAAANGIGNINMIYIDQQLVIP